MQIHELDSYNLNDAVKFHNRLNPGLWDANEKLRPEVKEKLLEIAADFQEFLGINDLEVEDITISGSNAAYSYTPHSDIDLHLVVNIPELNNEVYQELFNAKKYQYNDLHNIRVRGSDVELYVQPVDEPHVSLGIYSVLNDQWIQSPRRKRAAVEHSEVRLKYEDLKARIEAAIASNDLDRMNAAVKKVKEIRQAGLDAHGEFGPENLAFKMLRTQGIIKQLYDARNQAKDRLLSLKERERQKQRVRYGFGEASTPDGVSPTTCMFLNEQDAEGILQEFIKSTAKKLGIERMPEIVLHRGDNWSTEAHSFGRFDPETHTLHVSLDDRHVLDILRTTAHELAHCRQHELDPLPVDAGETGSQWENEAHAVAGIIMRDFANSHPDYFGMEPLEETSEELDEGVKGRAAAAMLAACIASGCATNLSGGKMAASAADVARTVHTAKKINRTNVTAEIQQEIVNLFRALGGDANAKNISKVYGLLKENHEDKTKVWRSEKVGKSFVSQGHTIVFTPFELEIYRGGDLVYRKPGYFENPTRQQYLVAKAIVAKLASGWKSNSVYEASGYIPTKAQANDPRFKMALTKDIRPGQTGKEANKMSLQTDAQGKPALLIKGLKNALREFKETGKLDVKTYTPAAIAKKHKVSEKQILAQLKKGIAVEQEHTSDTATAREIALDHLNERPDYYTRLAKVEKPINEDKTDVEAFIERIYSEYPVSPFNPRQHAVLSGEGPEQTIALFELEPSKSVPGAVEIHWIQAYPQRKGVGSAAIREIQAKAREAGLKMSLYPKPNGSVSQASLKRLYKRLGFNPIHKGAATMVWDPTTEVVENEVTEYSHFDLHHEFFEEIANLDPVLFENSEEYRKLKKTLRDFATPEPVAGRKYVYTSVIASPAVNMMNVAKFDAAHEFLGIRDNKYLFNIGGKIRVLPEQGGIDKGNAYQHIFMFNNEEDSNKMVSWVAASSSLSITFKKLD